MDNFCVFAVKRGNIDSRIDVLFYHPMTMSIFADIEKTPYSIVPLGNLLCNLTDGTHHTPSYTEEGIRFISVTNVTENQIDFSNTKYISREEHLKLLKRCNPQPGNILLTKIGSIGRAAIIPNEIPEFSLFVSVALLQLNERVIPEYLCAYLNTYFAKKQFERHLKGIGVPDLHLENIQQTLVIFPEDILLQKKLASIYMKAFDKCQGILKYADEMIECFENSVAVRYDIEQDLKTKLCFAIKLKNLDGVIDVKRYMNLKKISDRVKICDICSVVSEKINVTRYGNEIIDWIRIDDLPNKPLDIETVRTQSASEMEGSFFVVQKRDILVARLGPTILNQKIVMIRKIERETIASSEFLVLRCKSGYDPEAVMAILKTPYYRDLMYSHARGSTPSRYRLNSEDLLGLPFPDIQESQHELAAKSNEVRTNVKRMRFDAEREWETAKEKFTKALIGE